MELKSLGGGGGSDSGNVEEFLVLFLVVGLKCFM